MPQLAKHLDDQSRALTGADSTLWSQIRIVLATEGLESALHKYPPTESLQVWIAKEAAGLLLPYEREVLSAVFRGEKILRLTTFLSKILKPANGLPILTTNYDRLVEFACEMAGLHVDTTAIGLYAGTFDHVRSAMGACRGIVPRGKIPMLDHFPRAVVLKPHGSFDWYKTSNSARRCCLDLEAERLLITPGLNKYRAGYDSPFDKHRELANEHIQRARQLLIVGYGFNDDHLQTHLVKRIRDGAPTLILTWSPSAYVEGLAKDSPRCICLSKPTTGTGVAVVTSGCEFEQHGPDLWDLGIMAKELLS